MSIKEVIINFLEGQAQKVRNALKKVGLIQIIMFFMVLIFMMQQYQIFVTSKANPEIVSVDVSKLSAYIAKDIGASDLGSSSKIEQKKKLFLDFAKQTLQDTAKFNNIIILPSDVMIAGDIRDITDIVIHAFEKGK